MNNCLYFHINPIKQEIFNVGIGEPRDSNKFFVYGDDEVDEAETGAYAAPKFARRPAAGDKGYAYVAKQFGATPGPKKKKKNSRTEEVK